LRLRVRCPEGRRWCAGRSALRRSVIPRRRDRLFPAAPAVIRPVGARRTRCDDCPGEPGGRTDGSGVESPSAAAAPRRFGRQVRRSSPLPAAPLDMMPRPLRLAVKLVTRLGERAFAAVLVLVSLIVPRSQRIWAFGSWYGTRFADNPKYFFLHCASREQERVHAVWLSMSATVVRRIRALGFPAYHRLSPKGLWYA